MPEEMKWHKSDTKALRDKALEKYRGEKMDEFEKWWGSKGARSLASVPCIARKAWQEATKQKDVEIDTAMQRGIEAGWVIERDRIEEIINDESKDAINIQAFIMRVKDRIEKRE